MLSTALIFSLSAAYPRVFGIGIYRAYAHEAYVLPAREFNQGLKINNPDPLGELIDAAHRKIFILISAAVAFTYLLSFLWSTTKSSDYLDKLSRKAALVGPLVIRLAVSASFFFSAQSNVFLGPELQLAALPFGETLRFLLFLTAIMIFLGIFTEYAAAIGLAIFAYAAARFGLYMITYANYLGELIVLLLFGSRFISLDRLFFGVAKVWRRAERYFFAEVPIVRILYGVGLIYAGYTIKFIHQNLTVDAYNQYHLVDFFHASAQFIAAGAGLAEILVGIFILTGFASRWTVIISLVFITSSIIYFQELLWPHIILYGISFSLLINSGDRYTIDSQLVPRLKTIFRRKMTPMPGSILSENI